MWLFVQCISIALCEYYWFFIQVYNTLNKRDRTVNRSTRCVKQQQIFVFVLYNFFFCASKNVYDKIERKNRYTNLILFRDELFCSFAFTMRCMCVSVIFSAPPFGERLRDFIRFRFTICPDPRRGWDNLAGSPPWTCKRAPELQPASGPRRRSSATYTHTADYTIHHAPASIITNSKRSRSALISLVFAR